MSSTDTIERISGLDDLFYDVTLTDQSTGGALTTGSVEMRLCTKGTTTALVSPAGVQALTHVGAGRWTGVHDDLDVAAALAGVSQGQLFDRVVIATGLAARKLATCQKVPVVVTS
jgi:hypothetical protein